MYTRTIKSSESVHGNLVKTQHYEETPHQFEFYEFDTALVFRVIRQFSDAIDVKIPPGITTIIGAIVCQPLHGPGQKLIAFPLNSNIRQYPAEGEMVRIGMFGLSNVMFYEPINYNNSINYNGISSILPEITNGLKTTAFSKNQFGAKTLTPVSSDTIIQSKFGSSIRMTDLNVDSTTYNPALVISNRLSFIENDSPLDENINEDGSSIILLSGDSNPNLVPTAHRTFFSNIRSDFVTGYERPSTFRQNVRRKSVDGKTILINPDNQDSSSAQRFIYPRVLQGDQIVISSDRLIFDTKSQETLFLSFGQIGMFTNSKFSVDSQLGTDFNSPHSSFRINSSDTFVNSMNVYLAGENDRSEPAILGNKLLVMLEAVFGAMYQYISTDVAFKKSMEEFNSTAVGSAESAEAFKNFLSEFIFDDQAGLRMKSDLRNEILSDKVFIGGNRKNPVAGG